MTSTARTRTLGARLGRLRKAAGLTVYDAAEHLRCTSGKISKIENGHVGVKHQELLALLDLYKVTGPARARLVYLSEQRGDGYWWTPYSSLLSDDFSDYLYLEQAAMRLQKYEAQLIPGLLQTPGYATELMRQSHTPPDDDRIGTLVSVRMRRAELLREDATRLDVIIDEAVLHRRPSSAEVWRDQLDHLMEAANWPAVTLRVIPFGSLHAGVDGPYTIITFDTGDHVAYLESAVGGMIVEDEVDIARCNEVWHRISSASLTTGETINFIRKMRDHAS